MASPDFLCIGAQKSGTTWLDSMFKSHAHIWTPPVKELQFFNSLFMGETFQWTGSHRETHSKRIVEHVIAQDTIDWEVLELSAHIAGRSISFSWYEKIFDFAPAGTIKGEMTPEYSLLSDADVNLISKIYPNTKIIFIMRSPFSRALSGIQMRLLQNGFSGGSNQNKIDEFILGAVNDWDVIERGNYGRIISSWKKHFGEERCCFLLSDDISTKPMLVLKALSKFLGVNGEGFKGNPSTRIHVGKKFSISSNVCDAIKEAQMENTKWFKENQAIFCVGGDK